MPIYPNAIDVVNWVLYDRNTTAAAANTAVSYTFFNVPIGGAKTKADTNMDQVMVLPAPQLINVTHIGFAFAPNMILSDLQTFLNTYYMEFWVGQKIYAEGPLDVFPAATGFYGVDTRNNETTMSLGYPGGMNCMFDLRLPANISKNADGLTGVQILQGQNFKVVVNGTAFALAAAAAPTNGAGLNLKCYLMGQLVRGVQ